MLASGCSDEKRTAEDYVPDLSDLGLATIEQGRDPFAAENIDTWRALYQSADGRSVIVLVYVESSEVNAELQYATMATALEHPPPEFFGGDAEQVETDTIDLGDERRAFVTATPDDAGNFVWTDIYRSGPVIAIIQLLTAQADASMDRRDVAEAVLE
jgi:hypothetical protein